MVSNHVLHHLDGLGAFLAESAMLSRGTVVHNDIRRSPAAYALFFAGSWVFTGSYIRQDGLTSIRRSYTAAELAAAAPAGWTVARHAPFRNLLLLDTTDGDYPEGPPPVADVLIIGAGPVGLFMAALLLQDGVDVQVLEQRTAPEPHSRAIGIHPPALAALAGPGLPRPWLPRGSRSAGESPWPAGRCLAQMSFAGGLGPLSVRPVPAPGPH